MHYSWLCRKCNRTSYSSSAMREEEYVRCAYDSCGHMNINPYFVRGEKNETISTNSSDDISQK